ncbi:hypothetical protein LCGC14_2614860, partial [marine sediment metagenome]
EHGQTTISAPCSLSHSYRESLSDRFV